MPNVRPNRVAMAVAALAAAAYAARLAVIGRLNSALAEAVQSSNVAAVKRLLDWGADPTSLVEARGGHGPLSASTTLSSASSDAIDSMLVRHGLDLGPQKSIGRGYLQTAFAYGEQETVRALLDRGVDPAIPVSPDGSFIAYSSNGTAALRPLVALLRSRGARLTLVQAAIVGDLAEVTRQLDAGTPADKPSPGGATALGAAAASGDLRMMTVLLARGADPNYGMPYRSYSPLMSSALRGDLTAARALLQHGANPNAGTDYSTPLLTAIYGAERRSTSPLQNGTAPEYRNAEVARLLLAHGANPDSLPPRAAGDCAIAEAIEWMPEILTDLLRRSRDMSGGAGAPLKAAIRARRLELIPEFLRRGATVNPSPPSGIRSYVSVAPSKSAYGPDQLAPVSPLATAACYAPACVPLLRSRGATLGPDRDSILAAAAQVRRTDLFPALLRLGANVDGEDAGGESALTQAVVHAPSAVKLLLDWGADPNFETRSKRRPLDLAASAGDVNCVRLLLARGAKVNAVSPRGHSALYWARKKNRADIVSLLLSAGATAE
ncbi:MAG TPA: ankyrin repeat domain-containing protein [Chthonomonadaceae bacterium]|nr:ankyrin repeat domain-containing protein [Chthonomonadaceae bacterium]